MRAMKDSGVEWIGEIPQNWEVVRIKNVATVESGGYISKDDFVENGNFDVIGSNGKIGKCNKRNIEQEVVVTGRVGTIGTARIVKDVWVTDNVLILRTNCNIKEQFLSYVIPYFQYSVLTSGTAQPLMTGSILKEQYIPLPSLNHQINISDYLHSKCSKIDSIIERQQAVIEKLKEYKLSVITEAVTKGLNPDVEMKDSGVEWIGEVPKHWEVCKIKTLADVLPGYAFSSDDFSLEDGIALLRGINIIPNRVRWDDVVYWNKNDENILKTFSLKENDVVLGLDRPWIKEGTRVTVICENDLPCLLVQRVCRIRPLDNIDYRFVYHCLNGEFFKQSLSVETTGVSIPHISTKQILNFAIAVPNIAEQSEICHYLEKRVACIENIIEKKREAISKLQEYKKSLIYEVVTGKKEV